MLQEKKFLRYQRRATAAEVIGGMYVVGDVRADTTSASTHLNAELQSSCVALGIAQKRRANSFTLQKIGF